MKADPMVAEGYPFHNAVSKRKSIMKKWNKKKMIYQYSEII
jgi:hypothetical protein